MKILQKKPGILSLQLGWRLNKKLFECLQNCRYGTMYTVQCTPLFITLAEY